jgi:hypothetical protein
VKLILSPLSNAKIKNAWSYTFALRKVFMAWCLGTGTDLPFTILLTSFCFLSSAEFDSLYLLIWLIHVWQAKRLGRRSEFMAR